MSATGPFRDSLESSGHFSEASGALSGLHFGLLSEDPWLGWAGLAWGGLGGVHPRYCRRLLLEIVLWRGFWYGFDQKMRLGRSGGGATAGQRPPYGRATGPANLTVSPNTHGGPLPPHSTRPQFREPRKTIVFWEKGFGKGRLMGTERVATGNTC